MGTVKEFINRNRILVYAISSVATLTILSIIIVQVVELRQNTLFAHYLQRTDQLISENRLEESVQVLPQLIDISQSARDYLAVLERTRQLEDLSEGRGEGRAANLSENIILEARKKNPREQDLIAVHVNYLLDTGEVFEAGALARKISKPAYQSIKIEAFLRSGQTLSNAQLLQLQLRIPLSTQEMASPQAMIEAGLLTGDPRYFVNGIVMYAALGKIGDAFDILMERRHLFRNHPDAEILLRLAYDLARYDSVNDILPLLPPDLSPQAAIRLADIYFYRGETERSYTMHQAIADQDPSGISYDNQFNLVRAHGYDAELPLDSALSHNREKLLRHFLAMENESGNFSNSLNYYKGLYPELNFDWLEQLQLYFSNDNDYRIQDSILSLWNSINNEPDAIEARNLLLYFLALEDDRDEFRTALDRYDPPHDAILLIFQGYAAFLAGQKSTAVDYFSQAAERQSFQASYNLGLIAVERQNIADARKWFAQAASQAEHLTGLTLQKPGTLYHEELLHIRLYEGMVEALSGNYAQATKIVDFLSSLGYHHPLLARLRETISTRNRN